MAEPDGLPTSLPECVRQTRTQVPFDLLDNTNNRHLRCDVHSLCPDRSTCLSQTHQPFCYSNTVSTRPMLRACTYKSKLMLHKSFSNLYAPYKYSQSKRALDIRTYVLWGYFDYWDFSVGR